MAKCNGRNELENKITFYHTIECYRQQGSVIITQKVTYRRVINTFRKRTRKQSSAIYLI